jgi:thioredoxin reductase (NADPH)
VVAVVGYDDPAAEAALFATRFASKVYLVCPAPKLEVLPQNEKAVAEEAKIEVICGCRVKKIKGEDTVTSINLISRNGGRELTVSGVFLYLGGCQPAVGFVDDSIKFHEKGYILADPLDMSTSVPGVYGAGDVRWHELKQAVLAASDGAIAALAVDKYLHRRERMKSQHGAR